MNISLGKQCVGREQHLAESPGSWEPRRSRTVKRGGGGGQEPRRQWGASLCHSGRLSPLLQQPPPSVSVDKGLLAWGRSPGPASSCPLTARLALPTLPHPGPWPSQSHSESRGPREGLDLGSESLGLGADQGAESAPLELDGAAGCAIGLWGSLHPIAGARWTVMAATAPWVLKPHARCSEQGPAYGGIRVGDGESWEPETEGLCWSRRPEKTSASTRAWSRPKSQEALCRMTWSTPAFVPRGACPPQPTRQACRPWPPPLSAEPSQHPVRPETQRVLPTGALRGRLPSSETPYHPPGQADGLLPGAPFLHPSDFAAGPLPGV